MRPGCSDPSADAMVTGKIPFSLYRPSSPPRPPSWPLRTRTTAARLASADSTISSSPSRSLYTRTWDWRAGADICAPEIVGAASGWLTSSATPPTRERDASTSTPCRRRSRAAGTGRPPRCRADSAPTRAPRRWPCSTWCPATAPASSTPRRWATMTRWSCSAPRAPLRCSCWLPDLDNTRISSPYVSSIGDIFSTGSIGLLSGGRYYLDFIPYVSSYAEIISTVASTRAPRRWP
ncbi:uncharacterized protein LOC125506867 isoform X2 [Triticum urartu]|uniref:uncharacterized protein LOC125506867 isoform X2 n=1 Tax=Triticum urartu TaxID=4572 RepID=UPI00204338D3|nr:uncharacterized protein LOC125506867 isoform X2 [Triticum urartu]